MLPTQLSDKQKSSCAGISRSKTRLSTQITLTYLPGLEMISINPRLARSPRLGQPQVTHTAAGAACRHHPLHVRLVQLLHSTRGSHPKRSSCLHTAHPIRLSALRTPNGNGDDLQSAQPVQRGRQRRRHPSRGEGGRQIQRLLRPMPNPPLSSTLAAAGCSRQRPEAGPAPGSRGREGRQGRRASRRR